MTSSWLMIKPAFRTHFFVGLKQPYQFHTLKGILINCEVQYLICKKISLLIMLLSSQILVPVINSAHIFNQTSLPR